MYSSLSQLAENKNRVSVSQLANRDSNRVSERSIATDQLANLQLKANNNPQARHVAQLTKTINRQWTPQSSAHSVIQGDFREAQAYLETVELPPVVKKVILEICRVKNAGAAFALNLVETWKEEFHKLTEQAEKTATLRSDKKAKDEEAGKRPFVGSADVTSELNAEDLSTIGKISNSLVASYPPRDSVYVALGNSPIPIITKLQQQHRAHVVLMPLGGLSSPPFDSPASFAARVRPGSPEMIRLMNYINHFMEPYKHGTEKIVIVDYASSGTSMVIAKKLLSLYLGSADRIRTFVYTSEANVEAHAENYLELTKNGAIEAGGNDPTFNKFIQKNEEKLFKNVMHLTLYESVDAQKVMTKDDFLELIKPTLAGYLRLMMMINPDSISADDLY